MTLILATQTNPGIADWIDASLLGGGCTIIPAGGTISGSYDCLLCEGTVSMTGDVTVRGNMLALGDLTNTAGWDLTVKGDLHGAGIDFTRVNTSLPQGNLTVDGDLYFTLINMPQYGGVTSSLTVGGDLIGRFDNVTNSDSYVYLNGDFGQNGGTIVVRGSVVTSQLAAIGGECVSGVTNAGNGGSILIEGDCALYATTNVCGLFVFGGGSAGGGGVVNANAGNGGSIAVNGSTTASSFTFIWAQGNSAQNGNAGNGGTVTLLGTTFIFGIISASGGDCDSNNDTHIAGVGGAFNGGSGVVALLGLDTRGGDRNGTLSAITSSTSGANAGSIQAFGYLITSDIVARGGDVLTLVGANRNGGNGSSITVNGSLYASNVDIRGGTASFSSGGAGGNLYCALDIAVSAITYSGGYSSDIGDGGSGGQINCQNISCTNAQGSGGAANVGNGGTAGGISVGGTIRAFSFTLQGGNAFQGIAGSGGGISGNELLLVANSTTSLSGGLCFSTLETDYAGAGGSISLSGRLEAQGPVSVNGGNRSGATTVIDLTSQSPNAGLISVGTSARFYSSVSLDGGAVSTTAQNIPGGAGGSLIVYGPLMFNTITARGGSGVSASDGGNGGYIQALGPVNGYSIFLNGGDATNPRASGRSGYFYFSGGLNAEEVDCRDGTGGVAPVAAIQNELGGSCKVALWRQTDRANSLISSNGSNPASLQIGNMPNKQTLDDSSGVTGNISAVLDSSIFINNISPNRWYTITGVPT